MNPWAGGSSPLKGGGPAHGRRVDGVGLPRGRERLLTSSLADATMLTKILLVRENLMELGKGITVDKAVRFGRPVISGTRVPVELVLGKLAGGMSYDELCAEYEITRENVLAALDYAARMVALEQVHVAV